MNDIIDYIKKTFPKVVFNPINMGSINSKALGFIITDNKFVIGYIAENGNFCKVINPIDLSNIDSKHFVELLKSVPKVEGYKDSDLTNFIKLMEDSGKIEIVEKNKVILELELKIKEFQEKELLGPNVLVNSDGEKILIKAEYTEELKNIKEEYEKELQKEKELNQKCKDHIIYEKDIIIEAIKKYKSDLEKHVNEINIKENYQKIIDKLSNEKVIIETKLKNVLENETKHLDNLTDGTDYDYRLEQKNKEIQQLNETIGLIKNELDTIKEDYSKTEIENKLIQNHNTFCLTHILKEKDTIIRNIKDYTKEWLDWSEKNNYYVEEHRKNLGIQLSNVMDNLNELMKRKNEYISSLNVDNQTRSQKIIELTNAIDLIKKELQKSATEQLTAMSLKDTPSEYDSDVESDKLKLEILELKRELEQVKSFLVQNNNTPIKKIVDYNMCFETFTKFLMVNNMFYRKKQVIDILDRIIMDPIVISVFTNLSENIQTSIKKRYTTIRTEIYKHIDFLNLSKYMNDPNVSLFKSKSTWGKIPEQFCLDLQSISEYWDANIIEYREQDTQLTNIFEDLSGSLRIYIKIKPLIGIEQANNTVYIETIKNKKTRQVTVDCSNVPNLELDIKKKTYGDFYGIFDKDFSNLDVFTGIKDSIPKDEFTVDLDAIIEEQETVHPGLHSSFKQVEDGYSIVLFGYGESGSGKTYVLLGEKGIPGLIHYGLANLNGVTNIRVKNVFEQYINNFTPTLKTISGNIHHLVGNIKQLKSVSFDETSEFSDNISGINLNNISIESLNTLTGAITDYRISQKRIKKTPNNPVSSRSHLYIVFQITFETGKIGYITIVDTAGRESPLNIFNTFIEDKNRSNGKVSKTNITTILGPTGGVGVVKEFMKESLKNDYTASDIYHILKEGFYINETINHLIYFFNKKNYKKTKVIKQMSLDNYNTSKYYVDPRDEETSVEYSSQNSINNALTIPIMNYLDNLSKNNAVDSFRPTKFICMVCVRTEEKYCNQVFSTLQFANDVRSS